MLLHNYEMIIILITASLSFIIIIQEGSNIYAETLRATNPTTFIFGVMWSIISLGTYRIGTSATYLWNGFINDDSFTGK